MFKTKDTIEIPREWLERLIHIAFCEHSYSVEYLRAFILSAQELLGL